MFSYLQITEFWKQLSWPDLVGAYQFVHRLVEVIDPHLPPLPYSLSSALTLDPRPFTLTLTLTLCTLFPLPCTVSSLSILLIQRAILTHCTSFDLQDISNGAQLYADLVHEKLTAAGYYDDEGQFDITEQVSCTRQAIGL